MAIGSAGKDERIVVGVEASVNGVRETIEQLKAIGNQLTKLDTQIRKGFGTDNIQKEFGNVAKKFDDVTRSVVAGSKSSESAVQSLTKQVTDLEKAMAKSSKQKLIGYQGPANDAAAKRQYAKLLESAGLPIMGSPKSFAMLVGNMKMLRKNLDDTSKMGVATKESLNALDKGPPALMPALNSTEKLRTQMGALRKNVEGLSHAYMKMAKEQQWLGRQMIEGTTVPIVGLGTVAVRSFLAVQNEMIQLKKVTEFEADYDKLTESIRGTSREFGLGRKAATAMYKDIAALGVDGEENIRSFAQAVAEIGMVGDVDSNTALNFFRTMNAIFAEGRTDQEGLDQTRELMAKMSAVADETSLQLQDLAAAFPEVAPVMDQMGFSAEGVAASLAGMYKRGIPATEAAHGLKFALQRLVSPTKDSQELIDKMGFSFFDAAGKVKKADLEIMAMAKNLEDMSDEAATKALGELFGLRQSARMKSYFQDINIGRKELEKFAITGDKAALTSDYARGLVAAGFGAKEAGSAMERYNKALEEIKKDPTVAMKRLRSAFDDFKVQLGATITPAVISVGEKLTGLLDAFTNLPSGIQMAIVGAAGFAAVLGPIRYMGAQATHTLSTLGSTAVKLLPRLSMITRGMAEGIVREGGRGVLHSGSRFYGVQGIMDKLRMRFGMKTAEERAISPSKTGEVLAESAQTKALEEAKENLAKASAKVTAAEAAESIAHEKNTASMAAQTAATQKDAAKNAEALQSPYQKARQAQMQMEAEKKRILQTGGYEATGAKAGAQYRKNGKYAAKQEVDAYLEEQLSRQKAGEKARATAKKQQDDMRMYQELMARKREAERIAKLPPPPDLKPDVGKKKGISGMLGKILPEGGKAAGLVGKFKALIPVIALLGIKILAIVAVVAAVGAVIYSLTKSFRDNWDAFVARMQPGIEAIKAAFGKVREAVGRVVEIFTEVFSQLGSGSDAAGETASAVEGVGSVISKIFEIIASGMEFVAQVIDWIKPVFEGLAYYIRNIIGFISSIFSGDWKKALQFLLAGAYEVSRPVLMVFDALAKGIAQIISSILDFGLKAISKIPDPLGLFNKTQKDLRNVQKSVEEFSDKGFIPALDKKLRSGMGSIFGSSTIGPAKDKANDAGKNIGGEFGDAFKDGVADSAGSGEDWIEPWISKVYTALDREIERVKKSALESLEKSHEESLKIFDERIKAIDDQEKAEEKLYRTEEYLNRKRELLNKRNLDNQNYLRNRALAIYEGRYNDVRQLDLEQAVSARDTAKSLGEIERDRAKELLKETRDLLRDQINAEKEANKKRLEELRKAAELYLDLITEYAPATVEEFQSMLDQIAMVIKNSGGDWEDSGISAMERFRYAVNEANRKVADDFLRSGKDARAAWMAGFAWEETVAILGMTSGGGGAGQSGGAGTGSSGGAGTEEGVNQIEIIPYAPADPEEFKKWKDKYFPKGQGAQYISNYLNFDQVVRDINSMGDKIKSGYKNIANQGVNAAKIISKEWDQSTKHATALIDEFGNRWTYTNRGLVNQFGETGKTITDGSRTITGIQIEGSNKVLQASSFAYRAATDLFNEMINKGIRPGTAEAQNYEQRIRGLGYTAQTVNGQSILIPIQANDSDAKRAMGMLFRYIAEMNRMMRDQEGNQFIKFILNAKYQLYNWGASVLGYAKGGYVQSKPGGILANIGEGGYDEYVITTDPKHRAANMAYLASAASKLGMKTAASAAMSSVSMSPSFSPPSYSSGSKYSENGGDVYITVDTFIGEEKWFAEMANKYNMKMTPRERKIAGQQRRVVSSYNNRWDVK